MGVVIFGSAVLFASICLIEDRAFDNVRLGQMEQFGLGLIERFGWGGRREGAGGRVTTGLAHRARPALNRHHPVHVTLRLAWVVGNARRSRIFKVIRAAIKEGKEKPGFRIAHFSVQDSHIHLLVEADNRSALTAGLKGLQVRIARRINKLLDRSGQVFTSRYHEHVLKTPTETRYAIRYVLLNDRKHAAQHGIKLPNAMLDPCASGLAFDGWSERVRCLLNEFPPVAKAKTWLLRIGWRKAGGPISPAAIPAS